MFITETDIIRTKRLDGIAYLFLTESEEDALAWIAERYDSAAYLHSHIEELETADEIMYGAILTADMLAEYGQLLTDDNGNPGQDVPPCAGGTLAAKLRTILGADECSRRHLIRR